MEKLHWLVGGTVERCSYPGGIWTPIYTLLSPPFPLSPLSRSLLLSLSHSISLPLIRLAFTLATILPCSETQARHMDPGTINTRFPNQRPSLSRSLSFIISLLFSFSHSFSLSCSLFLFHSFSPSLTVPYLFDSPAFATSWLIFDISTLVRGFYTRHAKNGVDCSVETDETFRFSLTLVIQSYR